MPLKYEQLISPDMQVQYAYQKAKLSKALERSNSLEFDMLYHIVAREMAKVRPALIIPYVEISISPQCTLHCRDCANFMQFYHKPQPMDLEQVWSWIAAFIEAIDHIITLRLMGGEPLMQKQLPQLLERILQQPKVQHIQIVSNATLVPKEELLLLMSNNRRCSFYFSNYGPKLAPRYQEIVQICQEHLVQMEIPPADVSWFDMGDCSDRHLNEQQMAKVYQHCPNNCRHIWNGEFHHCPRSAHGKYLGLITDIPEQDYVPLLELDVATRRERISKMYDADYIKACNHCGFANGFKLIPSAIQTDQPFRKNATTAITVNGTLETANLPNMGLVTSTIETSANNTAIADTAKVNADKTKTTNFTKTTILSNTKQKRKKVKQRH